MSTFSGELHLQPSHHDISHKSLDLLKAQGFLFTKKELKKIGLLNKTQNNVFTIVLTCKYFSEQLEEFMLWSDLDIVILKKFKSLHLPPQKVMLSILEFDQQSDNPFENWLKSYNKFFKPYLKGKYHLETFSKYVNTFFILADSKNSFWQEWHDLSFELLEILQKHFTGEDLAIGEIICEEMAATLIYSTNPARFENLSKEYALGTDFNDAVIHHYEEYSYLFETLKENNLLSHYSYFFNNKCVDLLNKKKLSLTMLREIAMVTKCSR